MSCQQVPTAPAFNPYPRSVQVGEFDVATDGGIWVAIGVRGAIANHRTAKKLMKKWESETERPMDANMDRNH
jgi:hypothetical protein